MYRCQAWALQLGLHLSPQLMPVEQSLGRSGAATTSAHKPSCFVLTTAGRLAAPEEFLFPQGQVHQACWGIGSTQIPSLSPGDLL